MNIAQTEQCVIFNRNTQCIEHYVAQIITAIGSDMNVQSVPAHYTMRAFIADVSATIPRNSNIDIIIYCIKIDIDMGRILQIIESKKRGITNISNRSDGLKRGNVVLIFINSNFVQYFQLKILKYLPHVEYRRDEDIFH